MIYHISYIQFQLIPVYTSQNANRSGVFSDTVTQTWVKKTIMQSVIKLLCIFCCWRENVWKLHTGSGFGSFLNIEVTPKLRDRFLWDLCLLDLFHEVNVRVLGDVLSKVKLQYLASVPSGWIVSVYSLMPFSTSSLTVLGILHLFHHSYHRLLYQR